MAKLISVFPHNDSAISPECKIGPLVVVSETTEVPSTHKPTKELTMTDTSSTTVQTSTSKCQNCSLCIAVLIVIVVIYLITIILLFLCCQYEPRRWQQLRGMLSQSSTPKQGNDRRYTDQEVDYEVPPPEPRTATQSTISSSKQSEDSYMKLNPPEQKPAVYSELNN